MPFPARRSIFSEGSFYLAQLRNEVLKYSQLRNTPITDDKLREMSPDELKSSLVSYDYEAARRLFEAKKDEHGLALVSKHISSSLNQANVDEPAPILPDGTILRAFLTQGEKASRRGSLIGHRVQVITGEHSRHSALRFRVHSYKTE